MFPSDEDRWMYLDLLRKYSEQHGMDVLEHCLSARLCQGRFFSCGLDETHLQSAVRYVKHNPVRAGMAEQTEEYP